MTSILGLLLTGLVAVGGARWQTGPSQAVATASGMQFIDATSQANLSHFGMSFGAAWGDYNADGLPDLWVNNHYTQPGLYLNQGDGTFEDIVLDVWSANPFADTHGGAWADYDNDGDQDLIELVGADQGTGAGRNHLFTNKDGILVNEAYGLGVDDPLGRGRTPLWLDWTGDGRLDLLIANLARGDGQAPTQLYEQGPTGGFREAAVGFDVTDHAQFAQLTDLTGDGYLDLIVHGWPYPQRIYDMTTIPFSDITTNTLRLPSTSKVSDAILADFTNDLRTDLFLLRLDDVSDFEQESVLRALMYLRLQRNEQGVAFTTTDDVLVNLYNTGLDESEIFIGAGGQNPPDCCTLTLSPTDPLVAGTPPYTPGVDQGVFIGYDPATQEWRIVASSPTDYVVGTAIIDTVAPMTNTRIIGFDPAARPLYDRLLIYRNNRFLDVSVEAGFTTPTACRSGVSGDFDNDMDVDIYLLCSRPVGNPPNILYENQGDGTFVMVPDAGGAAGTTEGSGETVTVADYDVDGFLDLFMTNGEAPPPSPFAFGPDQLFRNTTSNGNHWLQIDLVGTYSNRDGIGAQVYATAGGETQLREQGGGTHNRAQDSRRIHFGLGSHAQVEQLVIRWPSGIVQVLTDIPADQVLRVNEPTYFYLPIVVRASLPGHRSNP
ncbi:MAG: CRTAC1 family protein [Anaerolineales bacterium]|nr:CRTAC1 family protein [Anaerolineales bacterium]